MQIKIISPSANILDEQEKDSLAKRAEDLLKKEGYEVAYSENYDKKIGYLSAESSQRANDLMQAFQDKKTNAILASQGGDNSNDLLDLLDFDLIRKNNKPFFGLSDVTVLLNVIAAKSKIPTFHGLDFIWGLGKNATGYTLELLNSILKQNKVIFKKNPNTQEWSPLIYGEGQGILLGGCLPSFSLLLGTKYDPIQLFNEPFILVLESIGQSKSEIHSQLVHLRHHNSFNLCKGIILGNFAFCKQEPSQNDLPVEEIAKKVFENLDIPLVSICEIGHCVENMIIPIGQKAKLISEKHKVSFTLSDK